uniref:Replication termination factor 2 n=1 Tax=Arion vulgaris TaxID=1028688 RepID=A0A0B6Y8H2_9EUPU
MGCDGGTIPKRDEQVRVKKKPEQKDKNSELAFKWKHCAISQETLVKPIVACELGRLYNKESVLEFLLDKSKFEMAAQCDHLRGLKDIKEMNLTDNPESRPKDADMGDRFIDHGISDYICPVVGLEMSGKYKFLLLWSCGCVLSERALKEVKSETCHKCGKKFTEDDIVELNGSDEEVTKMKEKMEKRRALLRVSKKSKKADKHKLTETVAQDAASSSVSKKTCYDSAASSSSTPSPPLITTASNGTKSKLSNGHGKVVTNRGSVGKLVTVVKSSDETKGKSSHNIQTDPRTSKTFKSLFTTSEGAKTQQHAHWVTYNPLYF